jgi:putative phage-type endonuclease
VNETVTRIAEPTETERREAWLAARREHITSSDLSAIMGLPDAYGSPMGVYLEKKSLLEKGEAPTYLEAGLRLQPVILEWYADKRQVAIEHSDPYALEVCEAHPILAASLDARWHTEDRRPVDAKNVRIKRPDEWGPDGTDEIPGRYIVQLHAQMLCTGVLSEAELATLFAGADPGWFRVPYDAEIGAAIIDAAETFWTKHVAADVPPPVDGSDEWRRFLASRREKGAGFVEATPDADRWAEQLRRARAEGESAEGLEAEARNHLAALIGDAAGMTGAWGRISFKATKGTGRIDWEALARELGATPEQIAKFTTTKAGSRVFRPTFRE